MNKLKIGIFLLFIIFSLQIFAQTNGIERSKKVEIIQGEKFYIHIVQKNQTAFSLSKAYGVKLDDIYKHNPGTENGLQLDQELRIPYSERAFGKVALQQDSISKDGNFVYHRVERGETLYRIMVNFQVNHEVLLPYNPSLTANLQPGDIIKIPTQDKVISDMAKKLYANISDYKVKKKDTYFRLQEKYGVSQIQLEQLNPQLKKEGLKKGQLILLPLDFKNMNATPAFVNIAADTIVPIMDSLQLDSANTQALNCDSLIARSDTFHIALMIPFYSDLESKIHTSSAYHTKEASYYRSFTFIQFYEGFLLALDSLKQMGFNAQVYIYDTKGDTATVKKIIQKPEFQSLDLIIGPLFNANIDLILASSEELNIKVINPFSREMKLVQNNSNLFKLAPSTESIIKSSCNWVADSLPNSRILVIHDDEKDQKEVLALMNESFQCNIGHGFDTNEVFFYTYKNNGLSKMLQNLSKDKKNVLVNLMNNEADISNFIRELNPKKEEHEIYIIGSELNWKRFETLEIKYLVDLHLTLCASTFIDSKDSTITDFEKKFVQNYKTIPTSLAFSGFDISWYFLNALYYYGTDFESCIQNLNVHTMSTNFQFKKYSNGGYENSYLNIYQYNNYQLLNKRKR